MTNIAENIASTYVQIRQLEQDFERSDHSVKLLAVSKRQPVGKIRQAWEAGVRDFGENYLQEALPKMEELADLSICWHYIGPMQSNKTSAIAEHFDWVHSVDRDKLASRLNDQRPAQLGPLNVCVQINLSGEASKSGISLADSTGLCELIAGLANLKLRGLMAIPAPESNFDRQRQCFKELKNKFLDLATHYPSMDTLSMGMSSDFPAAIAEGSTMVRIGTALFGERA